MVLLVYAIVSMQRMCDTAVWRHTLGCTELGWRFGTVKLYGTVSVTGFIVIILSILSYCIRVIIARSRFHSQSYLLAFYTKYVMDMEIAL